MSQILGPVRDTLNAIYHSSLYRRGSKIGPLCSDTGALEIQKIAEENGLNHEINSLIAHRSHRWTSAVNGIIQGVSAAITLLAISQLLKNKQFKAIVRFPLAQGALFWSGVGAHHLYATRYTYEEVNLHWNNSTFVWKKGLISELESK